MKTVQALVLGALLLSAGCFGAATDDDGCGDGEVRAGETCDGDCPESCDDANPCTADTMQGAPQTCNVVCENVAITVCDTGASDGCCPQGCGMEDDLDCGASCGNGTVDPGETCDGDCPATCDDRDACTTDSFTGAASTCDLLCSNDTVTACATGDGCCPAGCTVSEDGDCSATCGNGVVDVGETCDGNCPVACDDGDACTTDTLTGSAAACSAECSFGPVSTCGSGDGCCPGGCDSTTDDDCSPTCGNGVVDGGETCDGNCPTVCGDGDACTTDTLTGSAASCSAACNYSVIASCASGDGCCPTGCNAGVDSDCPPVCGNGYLDTGESCDGNCPTACGDGDACTSDTLSGSAASCTASCSYSPIGACAGGDGCCPTGCNAGNDTDCGPACGNGYLDTGEACDGNCPTACGDGDACTTDTLSGSAATCTASCSYVPVSTCTGGDGCCPAGCNGATDSDCSSGPCVSIADLRAMPDGVVSANLCPALVTYVSDLSYALQADPTGPAILVYEGFSWIPDVAVGDQVRLNVTQLSTYHGLKEINLHDPVQILSSGNSVSGLIQDLSAGIVPSEALESELVRVTGVTITGISSLDLTVAYGAATGVPLRVKGPPVYPYCVGATFDYFGLSTEYDVHRLQAFSNSDISGFDTSGCASLGRAPVPGDLVVNEVLADPPDLILGDANCDGTRDTAQDEFVELVNVSADTLDISGVTISDLTTLRYGFLGVGLPPGGVAVVFGGGLPSCTNWAVNVQVFVAGGLGLNNTGDTITVLDSNGVLLTSFTYPTATVPAGDANTSLTLEPDLNVSGSYNQHNLTSWGLLFSPGNRIDGTPFP